MELERFDWLAQTQEDAVDPHRRIVDAHHHFWKRGGSTYLAPELRADATGSHNVTDTVFVECMARYRREGADHLRPLGETEFVTAQAAEARRLGGPNVGGIVAFADLSLGDAVEEVLIEHERIGQGLFRGVRHATGWDRSDDVPNTHTEPAESQLADPVFRAGLAKLAERGHTYDAWLYHPQLAELAAAARACPELTIVVNHLGAPLGIGPYAGRRDEVRAAWRSGLTELASCPNVVMKLGGVGLDTYYGMGWTEWDVPPSSDEIADYWRTDVQWCIETFGPDRCLFESNFPVDRQVCSYSVLWNSLQKMAADYSDDEQDALFSGTALRVYRIS
jgi:L-fuconolactonase